MTIFTFIALLYFIKVLMIQLLDEMEVLYQATKLSELGIKLRMICARQIEMMLSGLYPNIRAIPFGSTVNSFGKEGCDLDIVLRYNFLQV